MAVSLLERCEDEFRTLALTYPEAYEDFPWGDRVFKVNKKIFLFLGRRDGELSLATKLPFSGDAAHTLPFASPTGYGLGKAGWVTSVFSAKDKPPMAMLKQWIDESYRAIAPKKLVQRLSETPSDETPPSKAKAGTKKKLATRRKKPA